MLSSLAFRRKTWPRGSILSQCQRRKRVTNPSAPSNPPPPPSDTSSASKSNESSDNDIDSDAEYVPGDDTDSDPDSNNDNSGDENLNESWTTSPSKRTASTTSSTLPKTATASDFLVVLRSSMHVRIATFIRVLAFSLLLPHFVVYLTENRICCLCYGVFIMYDAC